MLYSTDVIGTSRGKDEGEVFHMISKEILLEGRIRDEIQRHWVCRDFYTGEVLGDDTNTQPIGGRAQGRVYNT